jgi:hypothetical protein
VEQPLQSEHDAGPQASPLEGQIRALQNAEQIAATDPDAGMYPGELELERRHGGRAVRSDPRLLSTLHRLQREGVQRNSPAYYQALDAALSEGKLATEPDAPPRQEPVVPAYSGPTVQAPPTRDSGSYAVTGTRNDSRVVLSREARDLCASMGIDETEYARQVLKLRQAKAAGLLQDG